MAGPLVVLLTMLLAGCGVSSGDQSAGADQPDTATTSPLTGSFTTIEGGQIELSSLDGQDVVLWFWAPW